MVDTMPWTVGEEEWFVTCQQEECRHNEQSTLQQLAKAFCASRCPCAGICPFKKGSPSYNRRCISKCVNL